jgi:hypothetical protein
MSYLSDRNSQTTAETIPAALRFPEAQKASVVQSRESATYYPTSGPQVRSDQNRNTIFRLSSSDFLDPKTAYLSMRVSVPDYKVRIEDMVTSLISSVTLTAGGVELEQVNHVGDMCRVLGYTSLPPDVYKGHFHSTMGAWKHVPKARGNIYHTAGSAALNVDGDAQAQNVLQATGTYRNVCLGQVMDDNAYPMADAENAYATDWRGDGKTGHWVAIPLSLILSFFAQEQYIPLTYLGSIDLHINFEQFEKACLIGAGFDRDAATGILLPEKASGTWGTDAVLTTLDPTKKYYQIDDITIKTDLVSLDRSYLAMLGSLISSSASGLTIGFDSHSNQQVAFMPSTENTIYLSRGYSYVQSAYFAMRNQKIASNPYVCKSNYTHGDAFRSMQIEVGSKLYPSYPIRNTTDAYQALLVASDQHQHVDQGGLHTYSSYHCRPNQYQTALDVVPTGDESAAVVEPHRAANQTFTLGMNFSKSMGGTHLDGVSLRLSGYSIMLNLGLVTAKQTSSTAKKEPNGDNFNKQLQLTSILKIRKSLTLRADAVSVSE